SIVLVFFTKNLTTPAIPQVTADDETNQIIGANESMEWSVNNGATWTTYDAANPPKFDGDKIVFIRIKAVAGVSHASAAKVFAFTKNPAKFDLTILHTNDTHGQVENMVKLTTLVKQERAKAANSLLLNGGDVFMGTLYFNEFKGDVDAEMMNLIGYDAMTLGNHEFDLGPSALAKFLKQISFPVVTSNVNFNNSPELKEFIGNQAVAVGQAIENKKIYSAIVKEINGEKVGIFGLTTSETPVLSSPGENVKFEEEIAAAKRTVALLKDKGINKIIALNHIGYTLDTVLAKEVDEIDIIVGGHSHTSMQPELVVDGTDKTLITQAGDNSRNLGKLQVTFDKNGDIETFTGGLLPIGNTIVDDVDATKLLAPYKVVIDELKKKVIGYTDVALEGTNALVRTGETNLGNLWTDAMLREAKRLQPATVIALQNGGGIRASINQGDITYGELM
ncbi:MAG: DUF4073 domain-containing protein, partial [Bacilli bacterium]